MTAIYDAPTNTLIEKSEMPEPDLNNFEGRPSPLGSFIDHEAYCKYVEQYNAHIASLRTIICDPSCRDKFVHGGEYEENVHFHIVTKINESGNVWICVVPLSTPVQQDELWEYVIHFLANNPGLTTNAKVAELNKIFSITKKP